MTAKKIKNTKTDDDRPFFTVTVTDPLSVNMAVAMKMLPLNAVPINITALERWAHENITEEKEIFGLKIIKKEMMR